METDECVPGDGLASVTVQQLLDIKAAAARKHAQVVTLQHDQTVGMAMRVLSKHGILSAPLVMMPSLEDLEDGPMEEGAAAATLLGWVDVGDILRALLAHMRQAGGGTLPHNMLMLMKALEAANTSFTQRPLVTLQGTDDRSLMYEAEVGASLLRTIREAMLLQHHTVHRLAVFDAHGEISQVISQMDIIKLLHARPELLGGAGQQSLAALGLLPSGPGHVMTVDAHTPTLLALDQMVAAGVSGAAVLSPTGQLVANLSVSDLRGITPEHLSVLALPVAEFLAVLHGTSYLGYSQRTSDQASHGFFAAGGKGSRAPHEGEGAKARGEPAGALSPRSKQPAGVGPQGDTVRVISCQRDHALREVLGFMVQHHVHRVYVVDPEVKPEVVAVVTPTDVLRWACTPRP